MTSNLDRDDVMKHLNYLKGSGEELGKLSVEEDLTQKEREQVRKFVDIAKKRNEGESSHHWVVGGIPKNGLCLVKLARQ